MGIEGFAALVRQAGHQLVVGAVLCHAAVPISSFGERWPDGVDVELHLVEKRPLGR